MEKSATREAPNVIWSPVPVQGPFHRTWFNKCLLLVAAVFWIILGLVANRPGHPGPPLFFAGLELLTLWALTQDPTSLAISEYGFVVSYPGWKRRIDFQSVTGISLRDNIDDKGNVWAVVTVELQKRRPLKLYRFREGSFALNDALQSAWHRAKAEHIKLSEPRIPLIASSREL
jgi:hypothetical protein